MKRLIVIVVTGSLLLLGTACSKNIYHWGQYENSIYRMHKKTADYNNQAEIEILVREIEKTLTKGLLVPPGLYMHVGYLVSLEGDKEEALKYFELEKVNFPESATFVDGIGARLK